MTMKKDNLPAKNNYIMLLELAVEKDADIGKLEKLMELKERFDRNEASKSFKRAMVEFQGNKPELKKEKKVFYNDKFQYKFMPLSVIQKAIDPILSKCGLSYRWETKEALGEINITCVVSHIDGHEERTSMTAPKDGSGNKNTIQSIGSTVSYLKRYTLKGAVGLSADDDTDGNEPSENKKEELTPDHKKWDAAKKSLKNKSATLTAIKKKYKLTKENEKLLKS